MKPYAGVHPKDMQGAGKGHTGWGPTPKPYDKVSFSKDMKKAFRSSSKQSPLQAGVATQKSMTKAMQTAKVLGAPGSLPKGMKVPANPYPVTPSPAVPAKPMTNTAQPGNIKLPTFTVSSRKRKSK